jgi:putative ABC transport system ATP-binding protein
VGLSALPPPVASTRGRGSAPEPREVPERRVTAVAPEAETADQAKTAARAEPAARGRRRPKRTRAPHREAEVEAALATDAVAVTTVDSIADSDTATPAQVPAAAPGEAGAHHAVGAHRVPSRSRRTSVPAGPPAVVCDDLVKIYGSGEAEVRALDGVTASFTQGSFTAIMGPSGSGKSTLMHCLAGLDTPTSGHVAIGDTALESLNDRRLTQVRRDRIGFIFQSFNLLPTHTARQNIVLPVELAGRKVDEEWFDEVTASLHLTKRLKHLPSQLSGGEQQRVAVARALMGRPDVIFADEPTGALDSRNSTRLLTHLRDATRDQGQTIVMVTHDPKAASFADRALILSDGSIVDDIDAPSSDDVLAALRRLGA